MSVTTTDVAVVGAGLIGSSAALALRQAGFGVTLIDRDMCGSKASGVNFGGVRRQGRSLAQLPIAQRAHDIWSRLADTIGCDGEYIRTGHLKLARSQADLQALHAYKERTAAFDLGLEIIDGRQFRQRFPAFGPEVIGGSLCPQDGQANPRLVAPAFAHAARQAGALLLESAAVSGIDLQGERFAVSLADNRKVIASYLINAAGAWGAGIAAMFGDIVPLHVKYPTMAVTEPLAPLVSVSVGMEGGGFYARQAVRGNVVMGGGFGIALPDGRSRPGRDAIERLTKIAPTILPALQGVGIIRFWSGIEGYFDDKNPVIGFSKRAPGLLHAFGFSGAGFQIAPAVGEILAEMIGGKSSLAHADAYAVDRFDPANTLPGE